MNDRHVFGQVFPVYAVIASFVFVVVCGLLVFAIIHYRSGRGHEPSKKSHHTKTESLYVGLVAVIAVFLAIFAARENLTEQTPIGHPSVRVVITGFQWCWKFHYVGTPVTVTSTCVHSKPTLVVPTGEVVGFALTSADVVHEWWFPEARFKREAFPNHYNRFQMRFTTTGEWTGRCDEFCGLYHDRMIFRVKAVSQAQFATWLSKHVRNATGSHLVRAT